MDVVLDNLDAYGRGMWNTVQLTVLSFVAAMAVGVLVAGMRVSPIPPLRVAAATYTETIRNTPLLALMILFFFGFPKLGILYSPFTSAVIVLAAYTSTFVAETVRSGINAVSTGQAEAARSLGLTFPRVLGAVVLPQALRTVVAPLGSIFIALIKNSAIAAAISAPELQEEALQLVTLTARPVPIFLGTAVAYLMLTTTAGLVLARIERRVAIRR